MSRVGRIRLVRRPITVRGTRPTRPARAYCGTVVGRENRGSNLLVGRLLRRLVLARCRVVIWLNEVWRRPGVVYPLWWLSRLLRSWTPLGLARRFRRVWSRLL